MKTKNEELQTSVGSRSHGVAESGCRVSTAEKDSTRKEQEVTQLYKNNNAGCPINPSIE
jgi:hypothetical protein